METCILHRFGELSEEGRKRYTVRHGDTKLFIASLRAGEGLDGLQRVCSTVVFGEMDWTPAVHKQCIGRIARDGQAKQCKAFFLVSDLDQIRSCRRYWESNRINWSACLENGKSGLLSRLTVEGNSATCQVISKPNWRLNRWRKWSILARLRSRTP